jgi:hypothetical protein
MQNIEVLLKLQNEKYWSLSKWNLRL